MYNECMVGIIEKGDKVKLVTLIRPDKTKEWRNETKFINFVTNLNFQLDTVEKVNGECYYIAAFNKTAKVASNY